MCQKIWCAHNNRGNTTPRSPPSGNNRSIESHLASEDVTTGGALRRCSRRPQTSPGPHKGPPCMLKEPVKVYR